MSSESRPSEFERSFPGESIASGGGERPEEESRRGSTEPVASAYVHIPFCSYKCDFCDFAAFSGLQHMEGEYFDVLLKEIETRLALVESPVALDTIYYGGGTPGLVSPENIDRVHSLLSPLLSTAASDAPEITLETTPHAITAHKLESWRKTGINRLSIGVESMHDEELKAIGRDHDKAQALDAIALATACGFDNINIDFMYGLPTQTLESWSQTLDEAIALADRLDSVCHISSYGLQLAENSPLYSRFPKGTASYPDEGRFSEMLALMVERLTTNGFIHYEVSNFARRGCRSRHNLTYWQNRSYLAFGVGAHRYVDGRRSANWRSFKRYLREPLGLELDEHIDERTRIVEAIILGLRMREGIDLAAFERRYAIRLEEVYGRQIEKLMAGGFIRIAEGRLSITDPALGVSNDVLVEFI